MLGELLDTAVPGFDRRGCLESPFLTIGRGGAVMFLLNFSVWQCFFCCIFHTFPRAIFKILLVNIKKKFKKENLCFPPIFLNQILCHFFSGYFPPPPPSPPLVRFSRLPRRSLCLGMPALCPHHHAGGRLVGRAGGWQGQLPRQPRRCRCQRCAGGGGCPGAVEGLGITSSTTGLEIKINH